MVNEEKALEWLMDHDECPCCGYGGFWFAFDYLKKKEPERVEEMKEFVRKFLSAAED